MTAMTYDNFMMDKIVHQEIYKKRLLFVKEIQLGTPESWFAGYMEIIPTDPPIFRKKIAEKDYEFFDNLKFMNWGLVSCTFAGKMPYFKDHLMYIGFDTQDLCYQVDKDDCVKALRTITDFLDRKLSYEDQI